MNLGQVLAHPVPPVTAVLTPRDAMLHALGVGVGDHAEDPKDLQATTT